MRLARGTSFLILAASLISLAAPDVYAACTTPRTFTTIESASAYSYIYTPGYPFDDDRTISDDFDAVFWSLGGGDPAVGSGNDMGAFGPFAPTGSTGQYYAWLYPGGMVGSLFYPAAIYNFGGYASWSDPRVDGCIDMDGSNPVLNDTDQCMLVLLGDQSDSGTVGYFGLIAQTAEPTGLYFLNRAAGSGPIVLGRIPKPNIVASMAGGLPFAIDLTLAPPDLPSGAVYRAAGCPDDLVVGYKVYAHVLEPGAPEPDRTRDDGDPSTGWEPAVGGIGPGGGPIPIDQPSTVTVQCPTNPTILAISLIFESGFESPFVSENSTTIDCGGCFVDGDNDGFCGSPPQDCNDFDPSVYPNAPQICDGANNNCFDENWPNLVGTNEADDDGDGYSECSGDCDDADPMVDPSSLPCNLNDGFIYTAVHGNGLVDWQAESGFDSWNAYRGDLAELRSGGDYTQQPGSNALADRSCGSTGTAWFDAPDLDAGDAAFYLVAGSTAGFEGDLGTDSDGTPRPNANPCP